MTFSLPSRARRNIPGRLACMLPLLGLSLAAASCADDLTQPAQPNASPLASHAGHGFHAQYSIPIAPDSYQGRDRVPWTNTGIVIPRTGRYRLRVQGAVTLTANPAWPGPCSLAGPVMQEHLGDWGPAGRYPRIDSPLRVRFAAHQPSIWHPGFWYTVVNPTTVETEQLLRAGSSIWVMRTGMGVYVYCGAGTETAMYLLSGSQVLTVEEIQPEGRLVLECNGARQSVSVQRGANVDCTARAEPEGAAVTDARWTFQDARGDGPQITGPAGQNGWSGPMVVGGTITLTAKVNGAEQSATAAVTVTPRTWRDSLPAQRTVYCPAAGVSTCPLPPRPRYAMDLGQTALGPGRFALPQAGVQSGPNTGWHYIPGEQGPIRFTRLVTYLHSELQNPRSSLFRGACSASQVTGWITEHENVHVRKFRQAIARQRMNPELEEVVAYGPADMQREMRRANARIVRLLSDLGDGDHSDNDYPAEPCDLPVAQNP